MTNDTTPTGAESLAEVLARAERLGYETQLVARSPGRIECESCSTVTDPTDVGVDHMQRLEGASDAADMMMVIGAVCPSCGTRGVMTLGYGPNSSSTDDEVLTGLDVSEAGPFPNDTA